MKKKKILIVNNDKKQCGIYQHGISLYNILVKSKSFDFEYVECNNSAVFLQSYKSSKPNIVIFNHNSTTMPWLNKYIISKLNVPAISIIHTISQKIADNLTDSLFDYFLTDDPTILLQNPYLFKYGRVIQPVIRDNFKSSIPIIGSFGLCLPNKGFERLVYLVQNEFDDAIINLHIPHSDYNKKNDINENTIIKKCKDIINKPGIKLNITTGFLEKNELVDLMSKNSINAFLYDDDRGNGEQISGVMEYAISANRPIAITRCGMFRHFLTEYPNLCCIEDNTFTEIINLDTDYLNYFQNLWNENNVIWDFERIIPDILLKYSTNYKRFIKPLKRLKRFYFKFYNRFEKTNTQKYVRKNWYNEFIFKMNNSIKFSPTKIEPDSYNTILDNNYREFYKSQIQQIYQISNKSTERKIPESLVQHAFILDTIYKHIHSSGNTPKILSIGSYEDSVTSCLKLLGYLVDTIDPILNYDLTTFMSKPTTQLGSYDIVFSTSVLEHVEEDEFFMNNMAKLLKSNGIGVITCDFKKDYKKGDPKLNIDFRFYTKNDLEKRIIPNLVNCELLSNSNWDYIKPDFFHSGHNYSFASLAFRKK